MLCVFVIVCAIFVQAANSFVVSRALFVAPSLASPAFPTAASSLAQSPHPATSLHLFGGGKKDGEDKPGLGGNMGNMMEQFKKAQEIAKKTKELQDELQKTEVEGVSASGNVKVTLTGQQKPVGVEINVEGRTSEEISEDVVTAMKDAHEKSGKLMGEKMTNLYKDLGLPGTNGM